VINITKALGAQALMVKAFVLPPAQTLCPYHYEYEEEWLIVLGGTLVLRTPAKRRSAAETWWRSRPAPRARTR
jgi:uncharacterized cupin superfamily protein